MIPTPSASPVRAIGSGANEIFFATSTDLFRFSGALQTLDGWHAGDAIGKTATQNDMLWIADAPSLLLYGYQLPYVTSGPPGVQRPYDSARATSIASHDGGVYYGKAAGQDLQLVSFELSDSDDHVIALSGATAAITFDADFVYYVEHGSAGVAPGIYRAPRKEPAVPKLGELLTPVGALPSEGLVLVGGCLYFGGLDKAGGTSAIRVAPTRPGP